MKAARLEAEPQSDFDPKTITYQPHGGNRPVPTRTKEQLEQGAKHYGFELEAIPGGYMAYTEFWTDGNMYETVAGGNHGIPSDEERTFPVEVSVWDEKGRLVRHDWIGKVGVHDKTGDMKGELSPLFSNVYNYDDEGRLTESAQVVTQNDFEEYPYRSTKYDYSPDGSFTATHQEFHPWSNPDDVRVTHYGADNKSLPITSIPVAS